MAKTRSSAEVWLVGKTTGELSTARLPTKGDVLRKLLYHHTNEKLELKDSVRATIENVLLIWARARIPSQRIDGAERKLRKLYDEYILLKKGRTIQLESCRMKEEVFKADLVELFDLSTKNALEKMKNQDDKTFLLMQREDTMSSSMSGKDTVLSGQEQRKRLREAKFDEMQMRNEMQAEMNLKCLPSTSTENCSSSSASSEYDEDYVATTKEDRSPNPKKRKGVLTRNVVASLDRVNISDRKAMFVVGSVAEALGHSLNDFPLSRSSIRRTRIETRQSMADNEMDSFSPQGPLILHWDGKLLPNIVDGKQKVDRVAILVTGGDEEKLLAVPYITKGTGQEQADACLQTVEQWNIRSLIRGILFDTTAANTGLQNGACAILERELNVKLVWIACRHHIFEVILSDVFSAALGNTSGPVVLLFKRFKEHWPQINQENFTPAVENLFEGVEKIREDMKEYFVEEIKAKQPRDDYLELLTLSLIFLGGTTEPGVRFRAPGATHHARWMAKAIYALKIYLFKEQFKLTRREEKGITDVCLFVALIYAHFWNEAPRAERAPLNDFQLLAQINSYPNRIIGEAAVKAVSRHLWYFSEHLVGLAFFDTRLDVSTKKEMTKNLRQPAKKDLKRLDSRTFNFETPLQTYVTERTTEFFDILVNGGKEKASAFLELDPTEWDGNPIYLEMKKRVLKMKVVNDCAERGIALIQAYNSRLTKDEEQKQFLLRLVAQHRKRFPAPLKSTVKTLK